MLKIEFFYFNVLPHSESVTVCGMPDLEAVPVAIKALAEVLGVCTKEVRQLEVVNSTFTGRLVGLYNGDDEATSNIDFIASVLCNRGVAQRHWLQVESITDSFPALRLRSTTREEEADEAAVTKSGKPRVRLPWRSSLHRYVKGTALLFRSGKFNLIGLTSCSEAEEWHKKLCAVIRDCWISGVTEPRCASAAAGSSRSSCSAFAPGPAQSGRTGGPPTATVTSGLLEAEAGRCQQLEDRRERLKLQRRMKRLKRGSGGRRRRRTREQDSTCQAGAWWISKSHSR